VVVLVVAGVALVHLSGRTQVVVVLVVAGVALVHLSGLTQTVVVLAVGAVVIRTWILMMIRCNL
jgi:hypothetical protein